MAVDKLTRGLPIVTTLLDAVVATGAGASHQPAANERTFQVIMTDTATVKLEASLDNTNWITLRTSTASEGFSTAEPWAYIRGNCTVFDTNPVTMLVGT